jgi:DNA polymerase III subunit gamma/tau
VTSTSYQVLARKYRPQSFDDVAGQGSVVQTLMRALDTGRVAHAFLFTGSRGVGKTTLARILARCLVCETGVTSKPCGACTLCKGVSAGNLTDVVEIDGASNNSVDQIRDLQELARFMPQLARFKIFIVDEVHMLSTSAFNALLKILEEPPPHVKFVFATTEPHKIPVTILSRCQRYDFKRLPQKTIVERLVTVLEREQIQVAQAGLEVIAKAADGGMRDALSLLDQVLSFAGAQASVDQITEALGIIDARSITAATDAAIAGDAKGALAVVQNAHARGHDLRQLLSGVAQEIRHLSVANAAGSIKGLADITDEDAERLDARGRALDGKDLLRLLAIALDAMDPMQRSEDPRLHVELALLRMARRPPLADALAVSEALVRLEALAHGRPVPPLGPSGGGGPARDIARAAFSPSASVPSASVASPSAPRPAQLAAGATAPSQPPRDADLPLDEVEDPPLVSEASPAAAHDAPVDPRGDDDDDARPAPAAPAPRMREDAKDEPAAPSDDDDDGVDPAAGLPLVGVDARFVAFADALSRRARPIAMHLDHARVLRTDSQGGAHVITVCFERELHERAISGSLHERAVNECLADAYGANARLVIDKAPAELADIPPSIAQARDRALHEAQLALEAHAKAHPVVEKAVALFGGQVRVVKRKGA